MKSKNCQLAAIMAATLLFAGCATQPLGPRVTVMPGPNKPFEVFTQDRSACEQYAHDTVRGSAEHANNRALVDTVIGTVLGTGLGAAADGGHGAAIGAAGGTLLGAGIGASTSSMQNHGIQEQFDLAYAQCMYAHGNQVPGFAPARMYEPIPPRTPAPIRVPGYAPPVGY